MTTESVVGSAARAWSTALGKLAAVIPGAIHEKGSSDTELLFTTAPVASLNGILSTSAEPDVEGIEALAGLAHQQTNVPWSIQVRGEGNTEVARVAADFGLTERSSSPFMLKTLGETEAARPVPGPLSVRPVGGDEHQVYIAMLAAGFEAPPAVFAALASSRVLDAAEMTAYLAELEGVPVGTGFAVRVDEYVGVFNISTPPRLRRQGYGRAVTAAVLHDAYTDGARTAFLHSSDMGVRVYESLGFDTVERWTRFEPTA